jgi:hypothetical protein
MEDERIDNVSDYQYRLGQYICMKSLHRCQGLPNHYGKMKTRSHQTVASSVAELRISMQSQPIAN